MTPNGMAVCPAHILTFDPPLCQTETGPLAGLRVAVKDNFDIKGQPTGAGNPEWAAAQRPAEETAPLVQQLLAAGATITGKTQMDELAYSLMGQNARYGTPLNPAAPDRMPGGSSSGSASAVASGLADVGLGTDTGGSIRIPASFCGLWGWRPTHGLLSATGIVPLAPSYDVPGILTRDPQTLLSVASTLCPEGPARDLSPRSPSDLWDAVPPEVAEALKTWREGPDRPLFGPYLFATLFETFRICQGAEVADQFGGWVRQTEPAFGPGVRDRFAGAMAITAAQRESAAAQRHAVTAHVLAELGPSGVVILPTAPGPAPRLCTGGAAMDAYRNQALTMLSIAGHAGLPQISRPAGTMEGAPIGLSVIGPRGSDLALIRFAVALGNGQVF